MCIRTFYRFKYRGSIFHIEVIFVNNYSNFANFCITIGPFDRVMLHLSGKNLNSFSSKIALKHFCKSGDDIVVWSLTGRWYGLSDKCMWTCELKCIIKVTIKDSLQFVLFVVSPFRHKTCLHIGPTNREHSVHVLFIVCTLAVLNESSKYCNSMHRSHFLAFLSFISHEC